MCRHVLTNPDITIRNAFDKAPGFLFARRLEHA